MVGIEVEAVVQEAGGDALVPELGAHVAARLAVHGRLRNAQLQALVAEVEIDGGGGHDLPDGQARADVGQALEHVGRELLQVDAHALQLALAQAGLRAGAVGGAVFALEGHVGAADPAAVHEQVDAVLAGRHDVALAEAAQVHALAAARREEGGFELDLCGLHGRRGAVSRRTRMPGRQHGEHHRADRAQVKVLAGRTGRVIAVHGDERGKGKRAGQSPSLEAGEPASESGWGRKRGAKTETRPGICRAG
ncbi:hypothetical protein D9M72_447440 [compost metagenome]